jgi:transposase
VSAGKKWGAPRAKRTAGTPAQMEKPAPRHSSIGRPRALTDSQVAEILEWNKARAGLETYRQIAARLGVSPGVVRRAVKCQGQYKMAGRPEGSTEQGRPKTA